MLDGLFPSDKTCHEVTESIVHLASYGLNHLLINAWHNYFDKKLSRTWHKE